jgi:hypothetical protein
MRRLVVLLLAGCPQPAPGPNPPQVWEALNGSEAMVKLVATEPPPF